MAYDVIIIRAGPAGLTAGLYAARGGMKTAVFEKGATGGQMSSSWEIENYPGVPADSSGPDIANRMREQAASFGVEFVQDTVYNFAKDGDTITVETDEHTYTCGALILALGADPRLLGAPGEKELRGLGVSYCATCDANFFRDMDVAVVGGGDTALEEAAYLTKFAKKVTLIHRRDEFRGAKILQERIKKNPKIEILYDSTVDSIQSGPDGLVDKIEVRNLISGKVEDLPVQGIFIFVGHIPNTRFLEGKVRLTGSGYIPTNDRMETDVPGVYAAGDVREKELRQIVTATADGAIAAVNAVKYVEEFE